MSTCRDFVEVILLYSLEFCLVFFIGLFFLSNLGPSTFEYIFYIAGLIVFIPFMVYFYYKKKDMFNPINLSSDAPI